VNSIRSFHDSLTHRAWLPICAQVGPVVTDNGNFIIDVDFGPINDPPALDQRLKNIAGVLGTGLFVGVASRAYFGQINGSVTWRDRPPSQRT
jgi:ribose 5-phosphate isomerase